MRGRVMALYSVVFLGSTPIGAPLAGLLSDAIDPRAALVMAGLSGLIGAALARIAFDRANSVTLSHLSVPQVEAPDLVLEQRVAVGAALVGQLSRSRTSRSSSFPSIWSKRALTRPAARSQKVSAMKRSWPEASTPCSSKS